MKNKLFLLLILLIASGLRLWKLGEVPISPDWDEVSLGYNAYSIMQTGRDEYGKFLPVVLRSFDDYKPALYAYLSIPSISIFGLNVFAVRLPSALFGISTVLATYFLVKELFKNQKIFPAEKIALVCTFLLAISPWHIQFSRIAFESNVGLAFNIWAILFFLKGLKKPGFLILSAILMALNVYVYQSEKVFTPLILFSLIIIYRKQFFSLPRKIIGPCLVVGLLILMPMIIFSLSNKNAFERAKGVSIFSQPYPKSLADKALQDNNNHDLLGLFFDNRRIYYSKEIISGYLSHFDLNWLFINGDIARHHAPNMGLLYLFEAPFIFIGIYFLIFGNFDKKTKLFIFCWFLIAPIPASITSGVPHAVRTLNFLPIFQIFTALGLLSFFHLVNLRFKSTFKNLALILFIFLALFNFAYYLDQYFVQQNFLTARDWQYGYAKIVPEIEKMKGIKKIVVSNQPPMDQSYMFFLFYLKYNPSKYQSETSHTSGGFRENHKFGIYDFRPINWDHEKRSSATLYVGRPSDFSQNSYVIDSVLYPDNKEAMKLVE